MVPQLVGVAPDLSPHYWEALTDHRSSPPASRLGGPGPGLGVNMGVVLWDLAAMRSSREWSRAIQPTEVKFHY